MNVKFPTLPILFACAVVSAGPALAEGGESIANMQSMMGGVVPRTEAAAPETTGSLGVAASSPTAEPAGKVTRSRNGALGYVSGERSRFQDLIARHAAENGVPFALADAVVRIESRYNPGVTNGGAVGLMQIKPQTARGLGYEGGAAGLKQPETNIRYGMKYLAQAYRMSRGDTCATVMRYQSGHYATRLSGANRAYCAKARTIMAAN
ncbi:transglycosylase SLT domain-containing protein [Alsobacter sp. SYSU M60028]|uniref:Transglycosylase SLT domain-containing protein n=1 Tax=Alsobacter ponti TaxID=2962936 RepID=A0ABT1L6X7_9HYPH|nr:transglycosylase SLT domain-containing protein [Alsobacter ponti]MCP8937170.1 transglycosylase SLT domain-containing protein [Alsobacter ponti]